MTWFEIKKAMENAGVRDDEEITCITCEKAGGDKALHRMKLGVTVKLAEGLSPEARRHASGCAS
jgi:hypothetical protein